MGKRKKAKKKAPQKPLYLRAKLPTTFQCPFCCSENSVDCKINRSLKVANLKCNNCLAAYVLNSLTSLMEPVDVYSRWLGECKKSNQGIFKKEVVPDPDGGEEELDYEVPEDDAWQEKEEDEDDAAEDEDEDGDFEPPSKKRNEDDDVLADEGLRKVAEIIGKDADPDAILKEIHGDNSDEE